MTPHFTVMKDERDAQYAESWEIQGLVLGVMPRQATAKIIEAGYFHPWYMILTKLMRLLVSPTHADSWLDIIGYAQLVLDDFQKTAPEEVEGL